MVLQTSIENLARDLRAHKLRALLTIFGITWGTVGVVLLLALGEGIKRRTLERQHGMGDGIVLMWPSRTTRQFAGYGKGRLLHLKAEDVLRLPEEIPELEAVTPEYYWPVRVSHGAVARNLRLVGAYPAYRDLRHVYPQPGGRFINQEDIDHRRRVIFLGDMVRSELFGKADPVGRRVMVNQTPFTVIGCLRSKQQSSTYGARDEWQVFVPATTFVTIFGQEEPDLFIYRSAHPSVHELATRKVYAVLGRRYQFDPGDEAALERWDMAEMNRFWFYFFLALDVLMGVGGAFTMLVGGIGVANIMYIAVRERTPEIGLKMAVGAKPRVILAQYLIQAMLLTLLGGLLGFVISWAVTVAVSYAPFTEHLGVPTIAPWTAVLTVVLLGVVGVLAGVFPARRAANMDPVQALGY
ncbi:MAG: ABC transporter permease [Planctomycetota bacterium]|jgi:putative ABC transport system permease protein